MNHCKHLGDLIRAEMPIIKRHFSRHKWFQNLRGDEEAKTDFVDKYGFIMREMYCGHICEDRTKCEIGRQYIPEPEVKPLYTQMEFDLK